MSPLDNSLILEGKLILSLKLHLEKNEKKKNVKRHG